LALPSKIFVISRRSFLLSCPTNTLVPRVIVIGRSYRSGFGQVKFVALAYLDSI
jgi:hypothetical protein